MGLRADEVYERVKADILAGRHGIGEQLSVYDLASEYGVSKTPVREALNLLKAEGLVRILPRIGYFTAPLTVKGVQDMFEFRMILESRACRLAAARATDEDLAGLDDPSASYVMGDVSTYRPWLEYQCRFHRGIGAATHNAELAEAVGNTIDRGQRVLRESLDIIPFSQQQTEDHSRIIAAIRRHDVDEAERAVVEHINTAWENVRCLILKQSGEWHLR